LKRKAWNQRNFQEEEEGIPERKINELETNRKNKSITKLYRAIKEFKESYRPRKNIVKHD